MKAKHNKHTATTSTNLQPSSSRQRSYTHTILTPNSLLSSNVLEVPTGSSRASARFPLPTKLQNTQQDTPVMQTPPISSHEYLQLPQAQRHMHAMDGEGSERLLEWETDNAKVGRMRMRFSSDSGKNGNNNTDNNKTNTNDETGAEWIRVTLKLYHDSGLLHLSAADHNFDKHVRPTCVHTAAPTVHSTLEFQQNPSFSPIHSPSFKNTLILHYSANPVPLLLRHHLPQKVASWFNAIDKSIRRHLSTENNAPSIVLPPNIPQIPTSPRPTRLQEQLHVHFDLPSDSSSDHTTITTLETAVAETKQTNAKLTTSLENALDDASFARAIVQDLTAQNATLQARIDAAESENLLTKETIAKLVSEFQILDDIKHWIIEDRSYRHTGQTSAPPTPPPPPPSPIAGGDSLLFRASPISPPFSGSLKSSSPSTRRNSGEVNSFSFLSTVNRNGILFEQEQIIRRQEASRWEQEIENLKRQMIPMEEVQDMIEEACMEKEKELLERKTVEAKKSESRNIIASNNIGMINNNSLNVSSEDTSDSEAQRQLFILKEKYQSLSDEYSRLKLSYLSLKSSYESFFETHTHPEVPGREIFQSSASGLQQFLIIQEKDKETTELKAQQQSSSSGLIESQDGNNNWNTNFVMKPAVENRQLYNPELVLEGEISTSRPENNQEGELTTLNNVEIVKDEVAEGNEVNSVFIENLDSFFAEGSVLGVTSVYSLDEEESTSSHSFNL
ncbi:hypothetical protein HK100_008867 [Physocladia obscura]|uniref:Uncharacterized protein n=1 Tax=Physocladia obscura TaxID=109957 RepID=A0AAD5T3S4_9FUNG|nr:hypothetical protein HK100_008867 [Physocladia obscura]